MFQLVLFHHRVLGRSFHHSEKTKSMTERYGLMSRWRKGTGPVSRKILLSCTSLQAFTQRGVQKLPVLEFERENSTLARHLSHYHLTSVERCYCSIQCVNRGTPAGRRTQLGLSPSLSLFLIRRMVLLNPTAIMPSVVEVVNTEGRKKRINKLTPNISWRKGGEIWTAVPNEIYGTLTRQRCKQ